VEKFDVWLDSRVESEGTLADSVSFHHHPIQPFLHHQPALMITTNNLNRGSALDNRRRMWDSYSTVIHI
jgi:hypothetical protein